MIIFCRKLYSHDFKPDEFIDKALVDKCYGKADFHRGILWGDHRSPLPVLIFDFIPISFSILFRTEEGGGKFCQHLFSDVFYIWWFCYVTA
jgi:hypothetical protein